MNNIDELVKQCSHKKADACEALLDYMLENPRPDQISGGMGDFTNLNQLDRTQLVKGIEVELEHTKDPYLSMEIAKDHLTEHGKYYIPYLEDAERKMKEEEEKSGGFPKD